MTLTNYFAGDVTDEKNTPLGMIVVNRILSKNIYREIDLLKLKCTGRTCNNSRSRFKLLIYEEHASNSTGNRGN